MSENEGKHLPGEITVCGTRYIWERHTSGAYIIDLMLLKGESEALAAAGALVLAYPRFARRARFGRSVSKAAESLYDLLVSEGWAANEILRAGMHAFAWLATQLPPTASSEEVEDAVGFSEPPAESTPDES